MGKKEWPADIIEILEKSKKALDYISDELQDFEKRISELERKIEKEH